MSGNEAEFCFIAHTRGDLVCYNPLRSLFWYIASFYGHRIFCTNDSKSQFIHVSILFVVVMLLLFTFFKQELNSKGASFPLAVHLPARSLTPQLC